VFRGTAEKEKRKTCQHDDMGGQGGHRRVEFKVSKSRREKNRRAAAGEESVPMTMTMTMNTFGEGVSRRDDDEVRQPDVITSQKKTWK
jgi:hypothetical protein